MTGAAQAAKRLAYPRHSKDRLDADERVGRADDHRAQPFVAQGRQKIGMRARILRAVEGKLAHDWPALKAHEIVLEVEPSLVRPQSRAQPIVRRRQHAGADAEAAAKVGGDGGETLALPQPASALQMNRQVAIAEAEPVLAAERGQRLHERPGLVLPAPTELRIVEAGERVHQRVGVGRDVQAEMLEIVADIGDDDADPPACTIRLRPSASLAPPMPPDSATTRSRLIETGPRLQERMMLAAVDSGADQRKPRIRNDRRRLVRLAHDERGGGGDLIRETNDADLERSAEQVGPSAQIDQRGQTGDPDRDARGSLAPRTSETVVDHDREIDPGRAAEPAAQRLRAAVRILRQQKRAMTRHPQAPRSIGPPRHSP